jgi:SynChlorMet cassette protein ScmC
MSAYYTLRLADGQAWQIIPAAGASSFVEMLAGITGLEKGPVEGSAKLIYARDARSIDIAERLPDKGWEALDLHSIKLWSHADVPHIVCDIGPEGPEDSEVIKLNLSFYWLYQRAIQAGGAPVHAALVARDGHGVLLAGRGGMGKSTCGRRIPPPWRTLSDDMALIVRGGLPHYKAHPVPTWSNFFMGRPQKAWDMKEHVLLDGIFFLEQAKGDEVLRIGEGKAAMRAYDAMLQVCVPMLRFARAPDNAAIKKQLFLNACQISKAIPSFILRVDLHGRFWEELDKVLLEA